MPLNSKYFDLSGFAYGVQTSAMYIQLFSGVVNSLTTIYISDR
jgi:hypothetical protein